MRKTLLALALLLAAAAPAGAAISILYRAGAWEAFGGTTDRGQPVCGMSTSGEGMWFGVKYFKDDEGFTVQLSSSDWQVKKGEEVRMTMRFDRLSPWSGTATGFVMSDGDAALELEIPVARLATWLREFRGANRLLVGFPDAPDVDDWTVSLAGTTAVSDRMVACINRM
jgi:hypothetical protein